MDALDRKMLEILSKDGRVSLTDLADLLPLSISATRDRFRRLEASGVIKGFSVQLDPLAIGQTIEAFVEVRLGPTLDSAKFESHVRTVPLIIDAVHLTGRFDAQIHVMARDVAELDSILTTLKDEVGAEETNTRLVLRSFEGFPRPPLELFKAV